MTFIRFIQEEKNFIQRRQAKLNIKTENIKSPI